MCGEKALYRILCVLRKTMNLNFSIFVFSISKKNLTHKYGTLKVSVSVSQSLFLTSLSLSCWVDEFCMECVCDFRYEKWYRVLEKRRLKYSISLSRCIKYQKKFYLSLFLTSLSLSCWVDEFCMERVCVLQSSQQTYEKRYRSRNVDWNISWLHLSISKSSYITLLLSWWVCIWISVPVYHRSKYTKTISRSGETSLPLPHHPPTLT